MPGSSSFRSPRAKGSWVPRLAGLGVVAVLTAGGLGIYLGTQHPAAPQSPPAARHHHAALSSKVVKAQTVGIIDFGPDDDGDPFIHDPDDHPLMLQPTGSGIRWVVITAAELSSGTPQWTANQMADGSEIFIYTPDGRCLSGGRGARPLALRRCNLGIAQRWRPVHATTVLGQPIAAYANGQTGDCLTAPPAPAKDASPADPGPATLTACGPARDKSQEIAFWWSV